jgi:hypothetical protein
MLDFLLPERKTSAMIMTFHISEGTYSMASLKLEDLVFHLH